jgi:hypothetical protein
LHELGHALNLNYEIDPTSVQSGIQSDNSGSGVLVSMANTAATHNTCFGADSGGGGND